MSDTSQGPGWWLASDGKWYPPELWTGPPAAQPASETGAPPSGFSGAAPSGSVGGAPPSEPGPFGQDADHYPGRYPPTGYGQYAEYPRYGPAAAKRTNGLAVASLVCAIAGFFFFLPAIVGIVLGFVARSQIRQSAGTQGGDAIALAGIIIGFGWVALLVIVFAISASNTNSNSVVLAHVALAAGFSV